MASYPSEALPLALSAPSNQVLDLLNGASKRITSSPSTPSHQHHHHHHHQQRPHATSSIPATLNSPIATGSSASPYAANATNASPRTPSRSNHKYPSGESGYSTSSSNHPYSISSGTGKQSAAAAADNGNAVAFQSFQQLLANAANQLGSPSASPQPQRQPPSGSAATQADASRGADVANPSPARQSSDVSALMQQFLGGGPSALPDASRSPGPEAATNADHGANGRHNEAASAPAPRGPDGVEQDSAKVAAVEAGKTAVEDVDPASRASDDVARFQGPRQEAQSEAELPSERPAQNGTAPPPTTDDSAAVPAKTPFDFVSAFDLLEQRPSKQATASPAPAAVEPRAAAASDPATSRDRGAEASEEHQPKPPPADGQPSRNVGGDKEDGWAAANQGIANLLAKLSQHPASKAGPATGDSTPAARPKATSAFAPAPSASQPQPQAPVAVLLDPSKLEKSTSSPSASAGRDAAPRQAQGQEQGQAQPTPPSLPLPQAPGELDNPDKSLHASGHAAALREAGAAAFDDAKTSGLSILSPSRSSNTPRRVTLNLSAKQPAGTSSLYPAKIETFGVALLPTAFAFQCGVSRGGLLPAAKVASFGASVACYAMSKGKVRLIHVGTGERMLLRSADRVGIRTIAAFQPAGGVADEQRPYLLAALTDKAKDSGRDEIIVWSIPPAFVQHGAAAAEPAPLARVSAERPVDGPLHRFTGIAWHPREAELAVSTSDDTVALLDFARIRGELSEPQLSASGLSRTVAETAALSGYALSADGAVIATVAADASDARTWKIRLASLASSDDRVELRATSPIDGAPVVSHLSVLGDEAAPVRALLVGFERNTVLGVYDVASRAWKHVFSFAAPAPLAETQFNVVAYDRGAASLLIASSVRSSIFAIRFEFEAAARANQSGSGGVSVSPLSSLCDRLQPGSVRPLAQIRECAVAEPCTGLSIVLARSSWARREVRVLVGNPEGIDLVHLPIAAIGTQLTRPVDIAEVIAIDDSSDPAPSIATPETPASPAIEPAASDEADQSVQEPSPLLDAAAATTPELAASSSAKKKKRRGKRGKRGSAIDVESTADTDPASLASSGIIVAASGRSVPNGRATGAATVDADSGLSDDGASLASGDGRPSTAATVQPFGALALDLAGLEARLAATLRSVVAGHVPAATARGPTLDPEQLAQSIAAQMRDTIFDALASAVADATNGTLANGIQSSVAGALPLELERLVRRPELADHLSRSIAKSILPAVQRTAVEVVSKVLAPHFEEVMMDVAQRVEAAIASEMTGIRKSVVSEQSDSLRETVETSRAVAAGMGELLAKLNEVSLRNAELEKVVQSLATAGAAAKQGASTNEVPTAASEANGAVPLAPAASMPARQQQQQQPPRTPANKETKAPSGVGSKDAAQTSTPSRRSKKESASTEVAVTHAAATPVSLDVKAAKAAKAILPDRVAVVGAGPVGCLVALALAQRGCKVDIYESRQDPRTQEAIAKSSQRSINLAISTRGLTGLRSVAVVGLGRDPITGRDKDLADTVLEEAVPMRARMIHTVSHRGSGSKRRAVVGQNSQAYGANGECINSVDRSRLNNLLLQHASQHPSIEVHFDHRLQTIDFEHDLRGGSKRWADAEGDVELQQKAAAGSYSAPKRGSARNGIHHNHQQQQQAGAIDRVRLDFDVHVNSRNKHSVTRYAGLVVGCDGAHSAVRSAMGSMVRMAYSHEYVDNGYVELTIPPRTLLGAGSRTRGDGGLNGTPHGHDAFLLDPNHLHIWPRRDFMLIALPNRDGSFTCTLFAPFRIFKEHLSSKADIQAFFGEHFPDAVDLIGVERLVEDLLSRRPSPLGSVRCKPYHYRDRAILIGDAAHAMLPFYGQGLNCGFEDVRVLLEKVDEVALEEAELQTQPQASSLATRGEGGDRGEATALQRALERYTTTRHPDLVSITQLASDNYREMASSVLSPAYLLRKRLDGLLMAVLPRWMWQSLYMMVTFSNLGYAEVVRREKRQQRIVRDGMVVSLLGCVGVAGWGVWRSREVWRPLVATVHGAVRQSLFG
ncbi:kynurenine 3-monooxygenase, mitochondrial precursor [Thecaphora frezii]